MNESVPSGIPSSHSLYLEPSNRVNLGIADILSAIFPPKYQPQYFKVAHTLMTLLLKEQELENKDLSVFIKTNNYSNSTLYGRVIPKLVHFGLVKKEVMRGRGKPIKLYISADFSEILHCIADSWEMIIAVSKSNAE